MKSQTWSKGCDAAPDLRSTTAADVWDADECAKRMDGIAVIPARTTGTLFGVWGGGNGIMYEHISITGLKIFAAQINAGEGATPLQGSNLNGATVPGSLEACIGECDHDVDCKAGLKCFQREHGEAIPGCSGSGGGGNWDYCSRFDRPLQGSNLNGATVRGSLEACIGECDHDVDCKAGLKCFQREHGEAIPGCSGSGGGGNWDYCYDPNYVTDGPLCKVSAW